MTPRNVRLVFLKEMRDTLRDRRALFISVILPILLYPLLMIGLTQVVMVASKSIWDKPQRIAVAGLTGEAAEEVEARLRSSKGPVEVVRTTTPAKDLEAGRIDAWVRIEPGFAEAVAGRSQGSVTIVFDSTRDASLAAERKARRVFLAYATEILRERWSVTEDREAEIRARIEPVKLEKDDKATGAEKGAKRLGPMLALMLVFMALSGAFYPAIDIMAGEKERGTMETLLVCPASRTEIVVGKYLTVFTMTMVTALLNFASMAITFGHFARMLPKGGGDMALEISPGIAFVIVLALVPLAGLFSAVALALSTFARSYKEGQHYLTPLFLAVMPFAMVALVPGTELSRYAFIPIAGVVLLVRDLMIGSAGAGQVVVVLASTGAVAAFAIWLSVRMFNKEDVLFRDPGGAKFTLFQRARGKGEVPGPAQAMALAALCMVLMLFLMPSLAKRAGIAGAFLFQFFVLVTGLPLLATYAYRLDYRKTFAFRKPPLAAWPAALYGSPAVLVIVMVIMTRIGVDESAFEPLEEEFDKVVRAIGLPLLILIPPIAEELLFRGFLLSGFRSKMKPLAAVALVAVIFAIFHQLPAKYLPTGIIGLWLGYLVVATGSIFPAIVAHLVNNLLAFRLPPEGLPDWSVGPAVVVLVLAIVLLERERRARAEDAG